jgi:cell volume regulation protein A
VLGLSIPLVALVTSSDLLIGLAIAALLVVVVRPVLVGALLLPIRLPWSERLFVLWAGLKGAVPILLGLFILETRESDAPRLYRLIFVVVLVSVVVQGGSVPAAARLLRLPMRSTDPPHPYATGLRLLRAPRGLYRCTVLPDSPAAGARVSELGLGDRVWLSLARRDGELLRLRQDTTLDIGDHLLVQADSSADLDAVFKPREARP